jgi:hypothetical protein
VLLSLLVLYLIYDHRLESTFVPNPESPEIVEDWPGLERLERVAQKEAVFVARRGM